MEAVRRHVTVAGRVHGVFFRDTVRRLAEREGVAGWIRNRPDGTVEAVFEGDAQAVERLVHFCHTGPPDARVERVEVWTEPPTRELGFAIR